MAKPELKLIKTVRVVGIKPEEEQLHTVIRYLHSGAPVSRIAIAASYSNPDYPSKSSGKRFVEREH